MEKAESTPPSLLLRVKCFSITRAPRATAATELLNNYNKKVADITADYARRINSVGKARYRNNLEEARDKELLELKKAQLQLKRKIKENWNGKYVLGGDEDTSKGVLIAINKLYGK